MARFWPSSDSRTPCCRPSTAGRIPILGQSPTKRPVVLTVAMEVPLSDAGWVRGRGGCVVGAGAWRGYVRGRGVGGRGGPEVAAPRRSSAGLHHADREQEVRVDPLLAGGDCEGDVLAARGVVEGEPSQALELDPGEQLPELPEDLGVRAVVGR